MAVKSEVKCGSSRRKSSQSVKVCIKEERNASFKKVSSILQKSESDRTDEEKEVLLGCSDLVKEVTHRIEKRQRVKDRLQEVEDPSQLLAEKCHRLAKALSGAHHLVVYTGAGISTAACIPDYRGTNGIWTLLQKGKDIGLHDLTQAEPTLTHMALSQLYHMGILKYVVSQNCDGLHLRSGLPKGALSEVHGNMYIEVCRECKPPREYWRLFDVTENTARFSHRTMRRCYSCCNPLVDTIVHFGERGTLQWPLNWPGACQAADKADIILCIGSSLKVLKKYPWLWGMDKPAKKRPKLYIVNLQWTPKDDQAVLKISGKCDEIMRQVMAHLQLHIPLYNRCQDPIFSHATSLHPAEVHTTTQPFLRLPPSVKSDGKEDEHALAVGEIDINIESNAGHENLQSPEIEGSDWNAIRIKANVSPTKSINSAEVGAASVRKDPLLYECKVLCNKKNYSNQLNPVMEIVYDGVKLKVEGNVSVEASVKINDDLAILCDRSKIDQSTFMFGSSYDLKGETPHSFHFVSVGDEVMECNEVDVDGNLLHTRDPFGDASEQTDPLSVMNVGPSEVVPNFCSTNETLLEDSSCKINSECIYNKKWTESNSPHDKNGIHFEQCNVSNKCFSISDFLVRDSCYNSINDLGCEMGISSSRHDIETMTSSSSVVNYTSPSIYSFVPDIFQIDHNYSKPHHNGELSKARNHCDGKEPNKNYSTPKSSPFCLNRDHKIRELKTVYPNKLSTNKLSSSQTTAPESTNILSLMLHNEMHEIKHENKQNCDDTNGVKYATTCSFCKINCGSNYCMFYSRFVPEFNSVTDSNKVICECCDEEDDDEEMSDNERNSNKDTSCDQMTEGEHDRSPSPVAAKTISRTSVTNPGWYGKGYRRRVKKKR